MITTWDKIWIISQNSASTPKQKPNFPQEYYPSQTDDIIRKMKKGVVKDEINGLMQRDDFEFIDQRNLQSDANVLVKRLKLAKNSLELLLNDIKLNVQFRSIRIRKKYSFIYRNHLTQKNSDDGFNFSNNPNTQELATRFHRSLQPRERTPNLFLL